MTTEEKARAYDEAIKVAKGLFNSPRTCFDIDQLTNIFPQLAESEDERIRKHIVKFIDEQYPTHGNLKEEKDKMLAYLEKQKEEEGYEAIPVESTLEYKLGFKAGKESENQKESLKDFIDDFPYSCEQKEQKPNLVPKIIRPKFAVGDTVCRNMWSDHTIREIYIDCDDPTYICINEEGLESHISFSEQDEWERKEPKPVEWDDYTEMNLDRAIQIIKNAKGNLQGYQSDDGIYECDKAIECLEHFLYRGLEMERLGEWSKEDENQAIEGIIPILKDVAYQGSFGNPNQETMLGFARRILKSLRPQPKQEWGGEDEEMFFFINELLENKGRDYFTTLVYDAVQNWLKNRFKSLRPQPKKELSIEKAIQWLDDTFYFLDNSSGRGRDCEITTHDFDSLEEMYDSFRKAVTVDSEPHWKPSEEQMGVLKKALYINPASGKLHELKENEVCILQSLLRELEKL